VPTLAEPQSQWVAASDVDMKLAAFEKASSAALAPSIQHNSARASLIPALPSSERAKHRRPSLKAPIPHSARGVAAKVVQAQQQRRQVFAAANRNKRQTVVNAARWR
jgi:hypothetical protein